MQFNYQATVHDRAIDALFKEPIKADFGADKLSCVIVGFVNRSGSNHLCDLLRSTGAFTSIDEILNSGFVTAAAKQNDIKSFDQYLKAQHDQRKSLGDAVWGFKAGWAQLCMLKRTGAIPLVLNPVILKVRRRDLLGQAISYFIAEQTNQWTALDRGTMKREEIKYDGAKILANLRNVMFAYSMLDQVTMLLGLPVQEVVYEDLLDRPQTIISDVTSAILGQSVLPDLSKLKLQIQRDAMSQDFRRQFLKDMRDTSWVTT